jgi:vacuolar-type H+-ATPase subunit F/Vma7
MKPDKHIMLLGRSGTLTLFQLFGFVTRPIETEVDLTDVLHELEDHRDQYGAVLLTSDVIVTERQQKKINALNIPILSIPLHPDQTAIGHASMEQLIEKAVGMKLQFLKSN